jgi:hypothetical protein
MLSMSIKKGKMISPCNDIQSIRPFTIAKMFLVRAHTNDLSTKLLCMWWILVEAHIVGVALLFWCEFFFSLL